ncbi:homeobox protein SIX3 [Aphelenchoides avenae]|nr:homeobox protein SIX3 [Aphelenchus avenae]
MLPVENLTDAVRFLSFYDHEALIVVNRKLNRIAIASVKKIYAWKYEAIAFLRLSDIGSLLHTSRSYSRIAKEHVERNCMIASMLRQAILDVVKDRRIRIGGRKKHRLDTSVFISTDDEAVAIFKQVEHLAGDSELRERFTSLTLADVTQVVPAESVLRAAAFALYASVSFEELFAILKNNRYSYPLGPLQTMWFEAHYTEAERRLPRSLGSADKHRVRTSFPLPETIGGFDLYGGWIHYALPTALWPYGAMEQTLSAGQANRTEHSRLMDQFARNRYPHEVTRRARQAQHADLSRMRPDTRIKDRRAYGRKN